MDTKTPFSSAAATAPGYGLWALVRYALKLGATGFGGPVALIGYMYRDLVEDRRWISAADYKEGLTLAQLAPGPLAAQLAIYLGYVHYRVTGATLVGLAFVAPSFLMVVGLGWLYVRFGGLDWMQSVFYGVGAAVIGIIAVSAGKLATKNLGKDGLLWTIFLFSAAATVITASEVTWIFLLAGILVWTIRAPPKRGAGSGPTLSAAAACLPIAMSTDWSRLLQMAGFFAKAGAFVFGSGLAIVPFLYAGVVTEHHWLTERQFVDAVAIAMITPGPVVITVGFIGYLIGGLSGASVASFATFLPCYLFTILPAPYFKKHGKRPGIAAFVSGATSAAIGMIAGSVVVLGRRSVYDLPTILIAGATVILLAKVRRIPDAIVVVLAAVAGLWLYPLRPGA